jgi:folate-binding protein YgfZ
LENVREEREIPLQALDHLRLEAGIPMSPNEIDGKRLPQEVDLDDTVSLTKGCFLGQETMARLAHRGQLRKRLTGWILEDEISPSSGAVFKDGVEVGEVTSLLRGISVSGTLAMGILKLSARDPEGVYRFGSPEGAPGRLVDLPFVRGSGFDADPRRPRQGAEKE